MPDARDQLTGAAQASAFAQELGSGIDYLIGCEARQHLNICCREITVLFLQASHLMKPC